jgi:hypothetical protein
MTRPHPCQMSRCYAISRCSGVLCKNYGQIVSKDDMEISYAPTCARHTKFFEPIAWKKRYMSNPRPLICNLEWRFARRTMVEFALQHELIPITQDDVAALEPWQNNAYFILLCAKHVEGFSPTWNPSVFKAAFQRLWVWRRSLGPVSITEDDISAMASVSSWSFATECFEFIHPDDEGAYSFRHWFSWSSSFWTERFIFDNELREAELQKVKQRMEASRCGQHFSNIITLLQERKQQLLQKAEARAAAIKEELLEVCWAPHNVQRLCLSEGEVQGRW